MSPTTADRYTVHRQLQTFRPVITADTFARAMSIAKLRFPFPHMVSLLASDNRDGRHSLVTQGTADIVLDSCVDAWTGTDLTPLSEELRKRVMGE